ncbi:hypothetical protein [Streptomyces sp. CAU 1734]|uniref:hypothetical protein n=1 Tax=Streptomyces sp. CAU 1734 TaxID=3140360 RepID=UPI003260E2A0
MHTDTTAVLDAYESLEGGIRRVFRAVGALPLEWTSADITAAACAIDPGTAAWALEVLLEQHLVAEEPPTAVPRYRLSAPARACAEQLCASADVTPALRRLAYWAFWCAISTRSPRPVRRGGAAQALGGWLPPELEDDPAGWVRDHRVHLVPLVRALAECGWDRRVVRIVEAWRPLLDPRDPDGVGAVHRLALDTARHGGDRHLVRRALLSGAAAWTAAGAHDDAAVWAGEALETARLAGDVPGEAQALKVLMENGLARAARQVCR